MRFRLFAFLLLVTVQAASIIPKLKRLIPCISASSASSAYKAALYAQLQQSVRHQDPVACELLFSQSEASTLLRPAELEQLLNESYLSIKNNAGAEYYACLAIKIIAEIVPEAYPEALPRFLQFALRDLVPVRVFREAVKQGASRLSPTQVNKLASQILTREKGSLDRLREHFLQLAVNLPPGNALYDSPVVTMHLLLPRDTEAMALILATTGIVKAWNEKADLLAAVDHYHQYALKRLGATFRDILVNLEAALSALDYFNRAAVEDKTALLALLHQYAHVHLSPVPKNMIGIEDLFHYARADAGRLIEARLSVYHPASLKKSQILALLHVADSRNPDSDRALLAFFQAFLLPAGTDQADLSYRLRLYLEATSRMPNLRVGQPCVDQEAEEPVLVSWQLPLRPFLRETKRNRNLHLDFFNLPALFLYHAFGIPVEESVVAVNQSEMPDAKELQDMANFFGERWCAKQGRYFGYRIVATG